ncbi:hypothetical protein CSUB01_11225 [Colletotrichum sublineola]|uniref:Cys/Met metabolism pyridoxal phosphate-dependent enzyme n=1 Tax=Colletotrichum sublineola TaxID=1173701 RepID=A0A066XLG6_COLSU|nr:hypothetical protein CSUB01_11225 [Colletotrichum sublineola]
MTSPYIVGDSSPFLKRVLIPFWVIRIAIMVLEIVVYAAVIAFASADKETLNDAGLSDATTPTVIAILVVILVIIASCLILDIVCIVKRSRRTLSPRFFLISNTIQTTVWLVLFILTLMGISSPIAFIIAVVILTNSAFFVSASFLGLLIYSSIIYHRFRKGTLRGNYAPANQSSAYNQPLSYTAGHTANEPTKPYDANAPRYEMDNRHV